MVYLKIAHARSKNVTWLFLQSVFFGGVYNSAAMEGHVKLNWKIKYDLRQFRSYPQFVGITLLISSLQLMRKGLNSGSSTLAHKLHISKMLFVINDFNKYCAGWRKKA
jgi:hypothetical protein